MNLKLKSQTRSPEAYTRNDKVNIRKIVMLNRTPKDANSMLKVRKMKISRRIRLRYLFLIVGITLLINHRVDIRLPESEKLAKAKFDEYVILEDPILSKKIEYFTAQEPQ